MTSGILDTCVLVDLDRFDREELPVDQAITSISLGELSVGPLLSPDPEERARRQLHLQVIESRFAVSNFDFDAAAARKCGAVMAGALTRGRTSRRRIADYQIAAIAITNRLALYTVNVDGFGGIAGLELRAVTTLSTPPAGTT